MSITTKTGDLGETSIFEGKRLKKFDSQIEALGQVDELSSLLGIVVNYLKKDEEINLFYEIQKRLYQINSFLSGSKINEKKNIEEIKSHLKKIEQEIKFLSQKLPKLNRFILPSGGLTSSFLHYLRAVCRRVERRVVFFLYQKNWQKKYQLIIQYLNRLSDLFFLLSRKYQKKEVILG
jgi:cob(I)alamin adenosyltransferase